MRWKLLFDREVIKLLKVEDVNLLRKIIKLEKWGNIIHFWLLADIPTHSQGFPWRFRAIILEDNPAGHCFVLKDLFPISFFKLVFIMLLKVFAADKIFSKICLKAIRATFFSNMWSVIGAGKGVWGWFPTEGKVQTFSLSGEPPPPISSLSVTTWSLYNENSNEWLVCFL